MLNSKNNFSGIVIVIICSLILLAVVFLQLSTSLKLTGGVYIYPLDDTYLHMSIARNIAEHGVWGITKYEFSSTSSSILYTLLLTGSFFIFGSNHLIPLIFSIASGTAILFVITFIAKKEQFSSRLLILLLIAIIIFTPLPVLMLSGMEHTLQISLFALILYVAAGELAYRNCNYKWLYILSPLVVMLRYEGLFIIGIISFLFLLQQRNKPAMIIFLLGILPVVMYGLFSINEGSLFLPNTIATKGGRPDGAQENIIIYYAYNWFRRMFLNLHLLSMFLLLLSTFSFTYLKKRTWGDKYVLLLLMILLLFIAHMMFAATGWLYRYEGYLVTLTILAVVLTFNHFREYLNFKINLIPVFLAFSLLVLTVFYPLIKRSYYAFTQTVQASVNVYEQHFQLARFVSKNYNEKAIAANDIGAIVYYSDAKVVDLSGLGSIEILKQRLSGEFTAENIGKLTKKKQVELAIIYDRWFAGKIPGNWEKIAAWEIKNNVICADKTVSFYSTSKENKEKLKRALRDFSGQLPENVTQIKFIDF